MHLTKVGEYGNQFPAGTSFYGTGEVSGQLERTGKRVSFHHSSVFHNKYSDFYIRVRVYHVWE